jgi:hypothetical protein
VKLETGNRSFSFAAPFLWSTLPNEMRQPSADGLSGCLALARGPFHKRLKTHLFLKSYPPEQSSLLSSLHLELNPERPWTPIYDQLFNTTADKSGYAGALAKKLGFCSYSFQR